MGINCFPSCADGPRPLDLLACCSRLRSLRSTGYWQLSRMGGDYCSSKSKFATRCGRIEIGPRLCLRVGSVCRSHHEVIPVSRHCCLGCYCYYQRSQEKRAVECAEHGGIPPLRLCLLKRQLFLCRRNHVSKCPQTECVLRACRSATRVRQVRRVSREMVAAGRTAKRLSQTQSPGYQHGRKGQE